MGVWLIAVIRYGFCNCIDKGANSLTSALLELEQLTLKSEKYLFYQISDKPTPKGITLVRFLGTYIYADQT